MSKKKSHDRPLWIPLKTRYFNAFQSGSETIEYRRYGGQWTEKHIYPGRNAVLGKGYSGPRLTAVVVKFETRVMDSETYGKAQRLALIHLRLEPASQQTESREGTRHDQSRLDF